MASSSPAALRALVALACLLALASAFVPTASFGSGSRQRARGEIKASLEDLEKRALSKPSFTASFGPRQEAAPTKSKMAVKVTRNMVKAVAPATTAAAARPKPVAAVQVPSAPQTPSGGDLGAAAAGGGILIATVAGAGAVANALTARGKAIVEAERRKAIEAAAAAEFARQQALKKKRVLAPGPSDAVRLGIAGAVLAASAGLIGFFALAPTVEKEAPAPAAAVKEVKKAAPAPAAPKAAAPAPVAPAPKVEAPKPAAPAPAAPAPAAPKAEAPAPAAAPAPAPAAPAPKEEASAPAPVAPKAEAPAPVAEAPKPAASVAEAPKPAAPAPTPAPAPKVEAPKAEAPKPAEKAKPAAPQPAAAAPSSVPGNAPSARALPPDTAIDQEFLNSLKGSKKGKKL